MDMGKVVGRGVVFWFFGEGQGAWTLVRLWCEGCRCCEGQRHGHGHGQGHGGVEVSGGGSGYMDMGKVVERWGYQGEGQGT